MARTKGLLDPNKGSDNPHKNDDPRPPMGRPTRYSKRLAKKICLQIATTTDSISTIWKRVTGGDDHTTIYVWLSKRQDFRDLYARSKEDQTQILADEILTIADTPKPGQIVTVDKEGKKQSVRIADMVDRSRLRVDSRKWLLSKLAPKKYGDRLEVADARDPLGELLKEFQNKFDSLSKEQQAGTQPSMPSAEQPPTP